MRPPDPFPSRGLLGVGLRGFLDQRGGLGALLDRPSPVGANKFVQIGDLVANGVVFCLWAASAAPSPSARTRTRATSRDDVGSLPHKGSSGSGWPSDRRSAAHFSQTARSSARLPSNSALLPLMARADATLDASAPSDLDSSLAAASA